MNPISHVTATCVVKQFVPWSPSCPPDFIANYKANSMAFAVVYVLLLMLHGRNFAVRLVKGNFEVKMSNAVMMMDIAFMLCSFLSLVKWANYFSIHHDDSCISSVAGDFRLSFVLISM